MDKLEGRIAVVTGAASGIGAGIAAAFAREGADVVVADYAEPAAAEQVLAAIADAGREALFVPTDVAVEQSVAALFTAVQERFGRVDVLVNNAGIFTEALVEVMSIEDWDRVVNTNLRGTFLCTRAFLPAMLERGSGRIINIASQLGQRLASLVSPRPWLARSLPGGCWSTRSLQDRSRRHCSSARPSSGEAASSPNCRSADSERSMR